MIKITSKKAGFRRCGIAHPKETASYPDGRFSAGELAILKAEPMLTVEIVEEKKDLTVADLKGLLDKAGVDYSNKANKAELQELLKGQGA
jgi:hypothetical protein